MFADQLGTNSREEVVGFRAPFLGREHVRSRLDSKMEATRVLLVLVAATCVIAQFGGQNKKTYTAERRDLPYVSCDVCGAVVKKLHEQVTYNRELYGPKSPKGKKMPEEVVSDILDNVCEAEKEGGEWIRYYDIVSSAVDSKDTKRKLTLESNESPGKCKKECQTIKKSCENLLESEIEDRDDLQALLYVDKKFAKYSGEKGATDLVDHVCKKMVSRCKKSRTYSTAKYDREDEEFVAVSEKDMEMEKLMASMQGMPGMEGQGLSMFNREDMDSMMDGYGGYGDGDEYGDDPYGGGMPNMGGMPGMGGDMEL